MSATKASPVTQRVPRTPDDAPPVVRGVIFGLLFSAVIWLLIALVFVALT
ncbi:MAG TPA: hypothetical protein VF143_04905 [Candidatus Nanopelagicales bacterium]